MQKVGFSGNQIFHFPDSNVNFRFTRYVLIVFIFVISSCAAPATPSPANMAFVEIAKPERKQETPTSQPTDIPTPQVLKVSLWAPSYIAETVGGSLEDPLRALFVSEKATANINIEVGEENLISQWVYALVSPFSTTVQGISKDDLVLSWQGQSTGPYGGQPILMDQNTYEMFSAVWGPAAPTSV